MCVCCCCCCVGVVVLVCVAVWVRGGVVLGAVVVIAEGHHPQSEGEHAIDDDSHQPVQTDAQRAITGNAIFPLHNSPVVIFLLRLAR